MQLFDDGIFEEDAVSGEAQHEESSEAALASSASDLHHDSAASGPAAGGASDPPPPPLLHPAGFLRGKAAHSLWVPWRESASLP